MGHPPDGHLLQEPGAQLGQATQDQPLAETCARWPRHTFGESARQTGGEYLLRWVTDAPRSAGETSDRFVSSLLKDPPGVAARCRQRLDLLAKVSQAQLTPSGRQWVEYFSGMERFVIAFFESQTAYEEAQALREEGRLEQARQALARCKPEDVIEQFAQVSSLGGITKGEQGIIVSMNLRWLPYIVSERQAEGLEPVRLRFEPTFHDPLAMDERREHVLFRQTATPLEGPGREGNAACRCSWKARTPQPTRFAVGREDRAEDIGAGTRYFSLARSWATSCRRDDIPST